MDGVGEAGQAGVGGVGKGLDGGGLGDLGASQGGRLASGQGFGADGLDLLGRIGALLARGMGDLAAIAEDGAEIELPVGGRVSGHGGLQRLHVSPPGGRRWPEGPDEGGFPASRTPHPIGFAKARLSSSPLERGEVRKA